MIIYPAIDLMDGKVVRLRQGRFDDATYYSDDPLDQLLAFEEAGAEWVHIVDLEGARAGAPQQYRMIERLAICSEIKIQAAGGVRESDHVSALLDGGVDRVVVGSQCVKRPETVGQWLGDFGGGRVAAAMDVRMAGGAPMVAISGWTEDSGIDLWTALERFPEGRLKHLLVTDVSRDGELTGPNVDLAKAILARRPDLLLQSSGGVSALSDVRRIQDAGASGIVVGKAIYEGHIDLKEALRVGAADHSLS